MRLIFMVVLQRSDSVDCRTPALRLLKKLLYKVYCDTSLCFEIRMFNCTLLQLSCSNSKVIKIGYLPLQTSLLQDGFVN